MRCVLVAGLSDSGGDVPLMTGVGLGEVSAGLVVEAPTVPVAVVLCATVAVVVTEGVASTAGGCGEPGTFGGRSGCGGVGTE